LVLGGDRETEGDARESRGRGADREVRGGGGVDGDGVAGAGDGGAVGGGERLVAGGHEGHAVGEGLYARVAGRERVVGWHGQAGAAVGTREVDDPVVAGRGVVELVLSGHREAERRAGRLRAGGADRKMRRRGGADVDGVT